MRLDQEFTRLPLDFDAERMLSEIQQVPDSAWRPHPQGHPGNWALPLIAVGGDPDNDATRGAMAPTPHLAQFEYLTQVLASFRTVFGRSRLMLLEGRTEATLHVDTNYYWAERTPKAATPQVPKRAPGLDGRALREGQADDPDCCCSKHPDEVPWQPVPAGTVLHTRGCSATHRAVTPDAPLCRVR